MTDHDSNEARHDLSRIIESAHRLGVEVDEAEALQWLTAMAAEKKDIVIDERAGVFGHAVTMLDFSDADLEHFRELGRLVEFKDAPGVETALALSGSAAQSKIQTYPGDADFFERINIHAPTRAEACRKLGQLIREKALSTKAGERYRLMEVRYGEYPTAVHHDGRLQSAGNSIPWLTHEVEAGRIETTDAHGDPITIHWEDVALSPGWCKLDWVIADAIRGQLANASNMIDATWEAPDGSITPLDGYLDPYFQEVYLEADSIPIFAKLSQHVSANALEEYVKQLEGEVAKYVKKDINYGKALKRLYNIFRYTGRYEEAAYLRELFDEPSTVLYQVWSLIRALDEALMPGSTMAIEEVNAQADRLILNAVDALEGAEETEIVRLLLRLRQALTDHHRAPEAWRAEVEADRAAVINMVNNFFYDKMTALPTIVAYIDELTGNGDL